MCYLTLIVCYFQAEEEAVEAEQMKTELGLGGEDDSLRALIQSRQQARGQQMDSFFANLEAKYAQPKKKGKKGK